MPKRSPDSPLKRSGFTLIETLVVIGIIAVLAALLTTAIGAARQRAQSVQCATNLKNIGASVFAFVSDNQGQLPGLQLNASQAGLAASIPALVSSNNWNRLPRHLAPYLGIELPADGTAAIVSPFVCPGVKSQYPTLSSDANAAIYFLNANSLVAGLKPFGNPNGNPRVPSLKLFQIPSPSQTFMLGDADKLADDVGSWPMADKPVHGKIRNRLFFDGHVEAAAVTNAP